LLKMLLIDYTMTLELPDPQKKYLTKRGGKLKFTIFSIEDFRASLDLQCREKSLQRSINNEAIGRSRDSMYMHSLKL
jgi:hypothetical protein